MYTIETKLASKNGYFTPGEARSYYGKYDRHGITWHWWGDGTGADNHDNIVNYMLSGASKGQKSVNYVLSDNKISLLVAPDNVAWTSQSGNPVSVSVECQPTLQAEGYKKAGWLAGELAKRYGSDRKYYPHKYWFSTACPGTISLDRIRQQEDKWQRGEYNVPAPDLRPEWLRNRKPVDKIVYSKINNLYLLDLKDVNKIADARRFPINQKFEIGSYTDVAGHRYLITKSSTTANAALGMREWETSDSPILPKPTPVEPVIVSMPSKIMYTLANAKLVNIKDLSVVKSYPIDTSMEIAGKTTWKDKEYYLTKYAVDNKTNQGFLIGDLKPETEPKPTPVPAKPEWELKLQDQDDTEYWLTQNQELIDITTGKPAIGTSAKVLNKNDSFISSAWTISKGIEYRITDYSFKKGIFNGIPVKSLTLTEPGLPNISPVVHDPNLIEKSVVIDFLESIAKSISDFIAKLRG